MKLKSLLLGLGLAFSVTTSALAFSQADVDKLNNTGSCPGGDLRGAYLHGPAQT